MPRPTTSRRIHVCDLPTTTKGKVLEITVSFSAGGINYATYKQEPKGYSVHVQPIEIGKGCRTFVAFTGVRHFLEGATRFNQKRLKELADTVMEHEKIQEIIEHVCQKNGLEVLVEPPAGFVDSLGNEY